MDGWTRTPIVITQVDWCTHAPPNTQIHGIVHLLIIEFINLFVLFIHTLVCFVSFVGFVRFVCLFSFVCLFCFVFYLCVFLCLLVLFRLLVSLLVCFYARFFCLFASSVKGFHCLHIYCMHVLLNVRKHVRNLCLPAIGAVECVASKAIDFQCCCATASLWIVEYAAIFMELMPPENHIANQLWKGICIQFFRHRCVWMRCLCGGFILEYFRLHCHRSFSDRCLCRVLHYVRLLHTRTPPTRNIQDMGFGRSQELSLST